VSHIKNVLEYSDVERSLRFKVNEEKSVFIPTQRGGSKITHLDEE
jgi:hypothetical protein